MFHKIGSQVVRCSAKQQLELGRKTCVNLSKPKAPESVSEINKIMFFLVYPQICSMSYLPNEIAPAHIFSDFSVYE